MTTFGEPRFLTIRRGPLFWEWKYREEEKSKYRATKIPRSIQPKDACEIICHDWCEFHHQETVTVAWELTDEEIAAGRKGLTERAVDFLLKSFRWRN